MTSLGRELESVKSELKSNCEKMSFDQKKFGTVNETLKEQLDQATEKIEQVCKFLISKNKYLSYALIGKKYNTGFSGIQINNFYG